MQGQDYPCRGRAGWPAVGTARQPPMHFAAPSQGLSVCPWLVHAANRGQPARSLAGDEDGDAASCIIPCWVGRGPAAPVLAVGGVGGSSEGQGQEISLNPL